MLAPIQRTLRVAAVAMVVLPLTISPSRAEPEDAESITIAYEVGPLIDEAMAIDAEDHREFAKADVDRPAGSGLFFRVPDGPLTREKAAEDLASRLRWFVNTDHWAQFHGEKASIAVEDDRLIIEAPGPDHRQIHYLLAQLGHLETDPSLPAFADAHRAEEQPFAALHQRVDIRWRSLPLADATEALSELIDRPIHVQREVGENVEGKLKRPVTLTMTDTPLGDVLLEVLGVMEPIHPAGPDLMYTIDEQTLRIGHLQPEEAPRSARVYDIRPLLADDLGWAPDATRPERLSQLWQMIAKAVTGQRWPHPDGIIGMAYFNNRLIVDAVDSIQWQVDRFIADLADDWTRLRAAADARDARLDVSVDVDWQETPLEEAIAELAEMLEFTIEVDWDGVRDEVLGDPSVTLTADDQPLRSLLPEMLAAAEATVVSDTFVAYTVDDTTLRISFPQRSLPMALRVYDLRGLREAAAGRDERLHDADPHAAVDLIMSLVAPYTWVERGGLLGTVIECDDRLLVLTAESLHWQIAALLEEARRDWPNVFDETRKRKAVLDQRVDVDWDRLPLEEAVADLAEKAHLSLQLDITPSRFLTERTIDLHAPDAAVSAILNHLFARFRQVGEDSVDYRLNDGVLELCSRWDASNREVHDVSDLVDHPDLSEAFGSQLIERLNQELDDGMAPQMTIFNGRLLVDAPGTVLHRVRQALAELRADLSRP